MKFKKILSLLTAAAMTLSLGITSVSADTTEEAGSAVAKIGDTGYTSLAAAFNAAANKATITVVADTSIIGENVILSGKNVTLDLNGKTVTADNSNTGNIQVENKATLTLKDSAGSGSIVTGSPYVYDVTDKTAIYVENANFVMNSGTISTVCNDPQNEGQFGVGAYQDSNVTINGGTIRSGWYCVASNGQNTNSNITINGGELISTADYAIYAPAKNSTVTINNGTVNGAAGAIAMRAGDLIVNGGTLTSDKSGYTGTWDDGTGNLKKAVVSLESGTEKDYGPINARIHGGKITMTSTEKPLMNINKQYRDLKFTIDGGAFSEDISTTYKDYLDSKATVAKNADDLYEVTVPNAVRMDSKDYPSIQAAVDVIKPTSTSRYIISLQRDVYTPTVIKNRQHITIKLEGHNITASGYNGVFYVENSEVIFKNKTIGDTTVGGVITAVEDQARTMGIWASTGAKVTLRELTYKQEISNYDDDHFDLIYANKDARVYVESGTFVAATPMWTLNKYDTDSAKITVTGGKFYKYNPAESYTEPAPQPTSFVASGYSVTADGDYVVVSQNPVAVNVDTSVEYFSLDDAVKAVEDNGKATIKLLENVSSRTIISGKKDITLDLNGKTVSAYAGKDGVFVVNDGATLTIEGEGNVVARQYMTAIAIDVAANATVNIKGGNFSQKVDTPDESGHYDFIYIEGAGANVNISGGTFTAFTPKWTLNIKDEFASTSKFNVTGGKFVGYNPAESDTEPNGPVSFVPGGYEVAQDSDGYYTVSPTAAHVAKIGEVEYTTLQDAVKVAANGDTITLISDVNTKTYAAMIDGKTLTINLNGHNITSGDAAIYAWNKANVTIDGDGTVTAFPSSYAADQVFAIAVWANNATVNINGGTYTQKIENVNPTEDDFALIYSYGGGVINIKGGTFKPLTPKWTLNLQDNTGSTISVSGGKFYNYNPAAAKTEPTKPTSFVADGYVATADESGNYTVKERTEFGNVAVMTHGNGKLTLFAGINFLDYRNAGFIVEINGEKTEVKTNKVYEQVTAGDAKFDKATADTNYIYGAELTLDPSLNGKLESFTVTPFADVLNKTAERIASSKVTTVKITGATAETTVEE